MVDKQIADVSSLNGTFNKRNNQISATKTLVTQNQTLDGVFQQVNQIKGAERFFSAAKRLEY